jgi:lipopolysaccharide transport system ATP-binding protein
MDAPIIRVERLSKRYIIGHQTAEDDGLRHAIERAVRSPLSWLRSMRGMNGKRAEEFWALKDVSFDVARGEVTGIIGRNGAGKSTLLKMLSRITDPTSGVIRLRGRVASLLEVGTGFHPELTGRENIFLNGAILGMSRAEIKQKFDEIVAFAEIERFLDTPVKRYSSGMYVRLAFAVAAHLEPEILIVDEVLAVGDTEFQKKCLGKMEDVATRQGRTVLFVSHQMAAIQHLCTRCLLLNEGRIVCDGPPTHVIDTYLSQAKHLTTIELSRRKDRRGIGDAIVSAIEFFDSAGSPLREAVSGQTLVIRVSFEVRAPVVLKHCRVSLAIFKEMRALFALSTDFVDKTPLHLEGAGYVEFIVRDWPLSGGSYHIACFLASDNDNVTQDWVDDAVTLDVVDGDFFGTGTLYHKGWQGQTVLVRHSWRLERAASTRVISMGEPLADGELVSDASPKVRSC